MSSYEMLCAMSLCKYYNAHFPDEKQHIFNRVINLCFIFAMIALKIRRIKSVKMTTTNNSTLIVLLHHLKQNKQIEKSYMLVLNCRNESGKTAAEVEIIFGQHVQMTAFILLYKELYENRTLGNITVTPISDNSKYSVLQFLFMIDYPHLTI